MVIMKEIRGQQEEEEGGGGIAVVVVVIIGGRGRGVAVVEKNVKGGE